MYIVWSLPLAAENHGDCTCGNCITYKIPTFSPILKNSRRVKKYLRRILDRLIEEDVYSFEWILNNDDVADLDENLEDYDEKFIRRIKRKCKADLDKQIEEQLWGKYGYVEINREIYGVHRFHL